ncbi:serine/threonine-protein kinase [Actinomadura fibrosa]|uniref:non-specific serine/threonine protein kinase n=1 Tax=Actinomadura fibrosa TaxID=111802 RepID=A0ABW2X954_9ACTN|nr:serine/threonine-protein kinase [Actinomadura fibrosa]
MILDGAPGLPGAGESAGMGADMGLGMGAGRVVAGRYRLLEEVGRGGMGVVWRARDGVLDREVAVKEVVVPPGLDEAGREALPRRAVREARSAARLSHPGVVTVFDVVEEDGRPWVVMELVQARSLQEVIRREGPLAPDRAARIGRQVVAALGAAHAAGILHRDVKPGNVLIARGDRAVLTDFGIAVIEGDASLTQTGALLGSPAYIAPERVRGEPAQPASDLWALGATLYAAVTGRPPFQRDDPAAVFGAVLTTEATIPPYADPLRPVLEGLLDKDPRRRLPADVAEALLLALGGGEQGRDGGRAVTGDAGPAVTRAEAVVAGPTSVLESVVEGTRGGGPEAGEEEVFWRIGGVLAYSGIALLVLGVLLVVLSLR